MCCTLCCHRCLSTCGTPAAEVHSEAVGGESDEDGDLMLVSPAPRSSRLGPPPMPAGAGDPLPDVRSLADALEAPPAVVGLQVRRCGPRLPRQAGLLQGQIGLMFGMLHCYAAAGQPPAVLGAGRVHGAQAGAADALRHGAGGEGGGA